MNEENKITDQFKQVAEEAYQSMEDNTQVSKEGMTFVRMNMPAKSIDLIMGHYKLSSVVDVNVASILLLASLANMENDGYKFGIFKTKIVDGKVVADNESSFGLDIHDFVDKLLSYHKHTTTNTKEKNENIN